VTPPARRRDPQPLGQGWEAPAVLVGGLLLGLALAALAGLGLASACFGGGWVWPSGTPTVGRVLGGLLTGHPGRGLLPAQARRVPATGWVYGCLAGCELLLLGCCSAAGVLFARYHRPGDTRAGMASRAETKRVLGVSQLHAAKTVIRPDLYGRYRTRVGGSTPTRGRLTGPRS